MLRDLDEGDALIEESEQTDNFIATINAIQQIDLENKAFRERLFTKPCPPTSNGACGAATCAATTRYFNC